MICRIDHIVLTVDDIQATCRFYNRVLGMEIGTFGESRKALRFGQQKQRCPLRYHRYAINIGRSWR